MSKKIVFMGTPEFSVQTLEVLAKSIYEIKCVYTQPPKKSSRGQNIKSSPIQIASEKFNLNVRSPRDLNSKEEYEYFKSLEPHIVIVVAYGKIIPKNYLNISEKGFLNIHASLLPKWRGAAPIQRSIINRDKETGISLMKIEEGLDVGPYMKQIKVKIDDQTTTKLLNDKLSKIAAENILDCIKLVETNKALFIKQDSTKATYASKIDKIESKINWKDNADNILAKINGLNPYPGAWFEIEGERYKIWKAQIVNSSGAPGEILDNKSIIACGKKSIKIVEIQKEGKSKLIIEDFLKGTRIFQRKSIF